MSKKLYYFFSSLSWGFCFHRIEILAVQEIGDENALSKVNTVFVYIFCSQWIVYEGSSQSKTVFLEVLKRKLSHIIKSFSFCVPDVA